MNKDKSVIGFVVAMEKEARLVLTESTITKEELIAGKRIYLGNFHEKEFVLIIAGIGKANAAMSTQILLDRYRVDRVINFGLAGGKAGCGLKAGDIVEVSEACQYDFDLSELDDVNIGYMQDYDLTYYPLVTSGRYVVAKCATGDRFTSKPMFLNIIKELGGQITDMEVGAIAQVCFANNVSLQSIKLISDVDCEKNSIYEQYANNAKNICEKIPNAIKNIILK